MIDMAEDQTAVPDFEEEASGDLLVYDSHALEAAATAIIDLLDGDQGVIDLSGVIDIHGGEINDFVHLDPATGALMVDEQGGGHFDPATQTIATFVAADMGDALSVLISNDGIPQVVTFA